MKYRTTLILAFSIIFASCGGGGTFVDGAGEVFTNISNGIFLIPVIF
jgi:hypothetical protein